MYYVYVLKSTKYKISYVGKTVDIDRRLDEHNKGKSNFTKRFKPWILIYKEEFTREDEAIHRERYLKSRTGRRWLKQLFEK